MHLPRCLLPACLLLAALAGTPARAYVLEGYHWTSDQPILMDLQLGKPRAALLDGSTSWNQVAEAAMTVWNPYLGSGVQFQESDDTATPRERDGKNEVFFSRTVYGDAFGDDVLAITLSFFSTKTKIKGEADVVVNSAVHFDSYRGDLRSDSRGYHIIDLRRVLIHEFGHSLGLRHVPQSTKSIMTPVVSDLDTIQADDIAGVRAIYGTPVVTIKTGLGGAAGQAFSYQVAATAFPTEYTASGLPPGLSIDAGTGIVSGTPTAPGNFPVTVTATNANGTGRGTLVLTFAALPVITSPLTATASEGQFFSYRITATGDPASFSVSAEPLGLRFDSAQGVLSGTPDGVGSYVITLRATNIAGTGTATLKIVFGYDGAASEVVDFGAGDGLNVVHTLIQGADGNFYGTSSVGAADFQGAVFRVVSDGTLTTLHSFSGLDGASPVAALVQGADGNFYGTTRLGGDKGAGTVFKMAADGTLTTLHSFSGPDGAVPATALIQGADGNFYGTTGLHTDPAAGEQTAYRITPDGVLTTLHVFNAAEGVDPSALVQGSDGNFYGTTASGGTTPVGGGVAIGSGTVFKMAPDGTLTTLDVFDFFQNASPSGALVLGDDGNLYGTTSMSNFNGPGTIFQITPEGTLSVLHALTIQEGFVPSPLVRGADGSFYGTTGFNSQKADTGGTVFRVAADGTYTTLHTFLLADGIPAGNPILATDGNLYGTTTLYQGGGSVYRVALHPVSAPGSLPVATLEVTAPVALAGSGAEGGFTVSLAAPQSAGVVVRYAIKGSAVNGTDYGPLTGKVKIKPGHLSRAVQIVPRGPSGGSGKKTVKLVLLPDAAYTLGSVSAGKVKILAGK